MTEFLNVVENMCSGRIPQRCQIKLTHRQAAGAVIVAHHSTTTRELKQKLLLPYFLILHFSHPIIFSLRVNKNFFFHFLPSPSSIVVAACCGVFITQETELFGPKICLATALQISISLLNEQINYL